MIEFLLVFAICIAAACASCVAGMLYMREIAVELIASGAFADIHDRDTLPSPVPPESLQ